VCVPAPRVSFYRDAILRHYCTVCVPAPRVSFYRDAILRHYCTRYCTGVPFFAVRE
jgi:hypothetical protein